MSPEQILALIDQLRARGVYQFRCDAFEVVMPPSETSESIVPTFAEDDEEEPKEKATYWRGYSKSELGLTDG